MVCDRVGENIDPNVRLGLFEAGSESRAGEGPVDEPGSLNEQPDHSARRSLLKLPGQQPTPPSTYLVAFTGSVLFCSVGRDSVHIQHCRVVRDSVHTQRYCYRMRVHRIPLPRLHCRRGHLLHRRLRDLPR